MQLGEHWMPPVELLAASGSSKAAYLHQILSFMWVVQLNRRTVRCLWINREMIERWMGGWMDGQTDE